MPCNILMANQSDKLITLPIYQITIYKIHSNFIVIVFLLLLKMSWLTRLTILLVSLLKQWPTMHMSISFNGIDGRIKFDNGKIL
jgi:hypothetical protein